MKNLANIAVRGVMGVAGAVGLAGLVGGCVEDDIMGPLVMEGARQTIVSGIRNEMEGPRSPTVVVNSPNPNIQSVQNHGYAQAKRPRYPLVFTSSRERQHPLFRLQNEFEVGDEIYFYINLGDYYPNIYDGTRLKLEVFNQDDTKCLDVELSPFFRGRINGRGGVKLMALVGQCQANFYIDFQNKWEKVASTNFTVE